MLYEFRCPEHGSFEVNQPITAEHRLYCPKCGVECQRVYSLLQWIWADPFLHWDDKKYREQRRDEANA